MKLMVFDVGGTAIKYCVMDESLERTHSGDVPTPQDTQGNFFRALKRLIKYMDLLLQDRKLFHVVILVMQILSVHIFIINMI